MKDEKRANEESSLKPVTKREGNPARKEAPLLSESIRLTWERDDTESRLANFLSCVLPAAEVNRDSPDPKSALIPWVCDVLLSEHSVMGYGRDLAHFVKHLSEFGIHPLSVTADHVRIYKASLLRAGIKPTTIARRLSVLRGTYRQFAIKGLIPWDVSQDIAAVKAPPVSKNTTPALTTKQAILMLEVIPTDTLQGIRDLAMLQTFFITGCRVSAITRACVGNLEFDGVEHYLHVTEKRNKKARKILLDAARSVLSYMKAADIEGDVEGPLFRPMTRCGTGFSRRHLSRKTPWRLVKYYCKKAGVNPDRLGGRGISIHSLRKTAINDAIRNGAQMHEVRQFAGHADIRTTELYFVRREEDAEQAARRIQIRVV